MLTPVVDVVLRDSRDVRPAGRESIVEPAPLKPPSPELLKMLGDVARISRDVQSISGLERLNTTVVETAFKIGAAQAEAQRAAQKPSLERVMWCECKKGYDDGCRWPACVMP